ncbi:hypothetical protein AX15_003712 [Amanita polypyramis BW_CC]|nr:hypothetical protein AX15_003712 [Amanita polypyramis BW_CC]
MPTIVSSSLSSTQLRLPPQAAFQPALSILKRPSPSSASPSSTPGPSGSGSSLSSSSSNLREREARYQAARERIFGTEQGALDHGSPPAASVLLSVGGAGSNKPSSVVRVLREPQGPGDSKQQSGRGVKGFGLRQGRSEATAPSPPSAST